MGFKLEYSLLTFFMVFFRGLIIDSVLLLVRRSLQCLWIGRRQQNLLLPRRSGHQLISIQDGDDIEAKPRQRHGLISAQTLCHRWHHRLARGKSHNQAGHEEVPCLDLHLWEVELESVESDHLPRT